MVENLRYGRVKIDYSDRQFCEEHVFPIRSRVEIEDERMFSEGDTVLFCRGLYSPRGFFLEKTKVKRRYKNGNFIIESRGRDQFSEIDDGEAESVSRFGRDERVFPLPLRSEVAEHMRHRWRMFDLIQAARKAINEADDLYQPKGLAPALRTVLAILSVREPVTNEMPWLDETDGIR